MLLVACDAAPYQGTSNSTTVARSRTNVTTAAAGTTPSEAPTQPVVSDTPVSGGDSGIEGVVTLGPQCPVVIAGQPCPDKPISAAVVVLDERRREVLRFTTGSAGNFRIALPPGHYTLEKSPPGDTSVPFLKPTPVTVESGQYAQVTVMFDTGIQ